MKSCYTIPFLIVMLVLPFAVHAQKLPVTTFSKEARAHFELGRLQAFHYQAEPARKHLDAALAIDSTFVLAYLHRAGMSNTSEEAMPFFEGAKKYRNDVTRGEQRLIDAFFAFMKNGNPERAIEIFTELSDDYPDDPYLPTYLGLRYLRNMKQYQKAKIHFKEALRRDSQFVQAYNWLGYAALAQQEYSIAKDAFMQYLMGAATQPRPYNSLGDLYYQWGKYEQAASYYKQALSCDPGFKISRNKLILVNIQQAYHKFNNAVKQQNAKLIADRYSINGQILHADSGIVTGTDAIERFWKDAFNTGITRIQIETEEIIAGVNGFLRPEDVFHYESNIATEYGQYQFMAEREIIDSGNYMVIWLETPEGWKIYRDIRTTHQKPNE